MEDALLSSLNMNQPTKKMRREGIASEVGVLTGADLRNTTLSPTEEADILVEEFDQGSNGDDGEFEVKVSVIDLSI